MKNKNFNKKLSKKFIILVILIFNSFANINRNPFEFCTRKNIKITGPKYKVIGSGKSGDNTQFVVIDTGLKTEFITQKDADWVLYSNN